MSRPSSRRDRQRGVVRRALKQCGSRLPGFYRQGLPIVNDFSWNGRLLKKKPTSSEPPYLRPDWDYRLWEFNANHRQLLLRCDYANAGAEQYRSEVWFGNVSFLVLAPIIRGLYLRRPDEADLTRLRAAHGREELNWAYVWLLNEAGTRFVVSGRPTWREGRRPFEAPSFFAGHPWPERPDDTSGSI